MSTAFEQYTESPAAAHDARNWLNTLDDTEAINLFVEHGPAADCADAWIDARTEQQMLEAWERDQQDGRVA